MKKSRLICIVSCCYFTDTRSTSTILNLYIFPLSMFCAIFLSIRELRWPSCLVTRNYVCRPFAFCVDRIIWISSRNFSIYRTRNNGHEKCDVLQKLALSCIFNNKRPIFTGTFINNKAQACAIWHITRQIKRQMVHMS